MSDELQGMVRAVVTTQAGGVGLTWTGNTLVVDDAHDFPRDGGQFKAEGYETVFNYVSVADGETEDDPDTITTVETAPGTFTDEFRLDLWPAAVSSVAEVAMPEALEDTVPASIPHSLKPFLVDGVRDPEAQESVLIAQRDMAWVVVDILGQPEVLIPDLVTSVDDAKAEALEAHGLASDATVAAQDAHNTAVAARDTAADATTAAGNAQTTATNALTSANGRNQRAAGITDPPTGTINALTGLPWRDRDTWVKWNNTTNRHVIGQWTREGTAWKAEYIESDFIANLDLNKLTVLGSARMSQAVVDKIIGDAAFFKVLTADRIQLQSGANVYYDGQFNDPGLSALRASNSGFTYDPSTKTLTGTGSFWLTYNALDEGLTMPLVVGQKYLVRVTGTGLTAGNYTFAVRDSSGYTTRTTTRTATGMEFVLTPTTTATRVNIYSLSSNSATIERVEFVAMVGSTIIEPGAVDTGHLKATAIDGMVITGATVQTAASGARVVLDDTGLKAYNSSGVLTSAIYGASGDFTGASFSGGSVEGAAITGGLFRTSSDTSRVQVDSGNSGQLYAMNAGVVRIRLSVSNGLQFYGQSGTQQGYIRGEADRLDVWSNQRVAVLAPAITMGYSADPASSVQLAANGQLLLVGPGSSRVEMTGGGIYNTATWFEMRIEGPASNRDKWVIRPVTTGGVNRAVLYFAGGAANMPSTTIASNLFMDNNGAVWLSTSARRFKNDIQDVGVDPWKLLDVPVRDWIDAAQQDMRAEAELKRSRARSAKTRAEADTLLAERPKPRRTPGVVAEEVEAAGLGMFVTYNNDGETSGVMYDRLALLLIPVVRDLRARLERLENLT